MLSEQQNVVTFQYVNAYNKLGIVLENQKKLTEAEEMYRRALALDDKLAPAYIGLGNVLRASVLCRLPKAGLRWNNPVSWSWKMG